MRSNATSSKALLIGFSLCGALLLASQAAAGPYRPGSFSPAAGSQVGSVSSVGLFVSGDNWNSGSPVNPYCDFGYQYVNGQVTNPLGAVTAVNFTGAYNNGNVSAAYSSTLPGTYTVVTTSYEYRINYPSGGGGCIFPNYWYWNNSTWSGWNNGWTFTIPALPTFDLASVANNGFTHLTSFTVRVTDHAAAPGFNAGSLTVNSPYTASYSAGTGLITVSGLLTNQGNPLTVSIANNLGQASTLNWNVNVDQIAPAISVPLPTDGSVWRDGAGMPTISAQLADGGAGASGVDPASVVMTLDGSPVTAAATASAVAFTPASLGHGTHTVVVTMSDLAGNPAPALSWSFDFDAGPSAYAPSPAGASLTGTSGVLITAQLGDNPGGPGVNPGSVTMLVDGATVAAVTDGVTVSFTAASLSAGSHTVTVDLKDLDGVAAYPLTWAFNANSDTVPPLATLLTPTAGSVLAYNAPVIAVSLTDTASGVALNSITMTVDGATVPYALQAAGGNSSWTLSSTAAVLSEGPHTVTVNLKDQAGNAANQLVWNFTVATDRTPPVATVLSPTAGSVLGYNNPVVAVSLTDTGRGVALNSVTMTVDGVSVPWTYQAASDNSSVTISSTAAVRANGGHTVTLDVADNAGNKANQLVWTFVVATDTIAPIATAPSPAGGSVTGTTGVVVSAHMADNAGGSGVDIASISMRVDGIVVPFATDGVTVSYTAATLSIGVHQATVDLKDVAGNAANQMAWTFTVANADTTAPTASAPSPVGASLVGTTNVLITAALADNVGGSGVAPASVSMTVDGMAVPATTDGVTVSYTALVLSAGVHHVSVDLKDLAGNAATQLGWDFQAQVLYCPPVISGYPVGGVAVAPNGNIYVVDNAAKKIRAYLPSGAPLGGFNQFNNSTMTDLAVGPAGNYVYTTEIGNNQTTIFNAGSGTYVGGGNPGILAPDSAGNLFNIITQGTVGQVVSGNSTFGSQVTRGYLFGSFGTVVTSMAALTGAPGQFYVNIAGSGNVYKFNLTSPNAPLATYAGIGTGGYIAADSANNFYVTDPATNVVRKYNSSGVLQSVQGGAGPAAGQFTAIQGVAVEAAGTLLVGDSVKQSVQRLGSYAGCIQDLVAPTLSNALPAGGSTVTTASPVVAALISDASPSSGYSAAGISVTVDGLSKAFTLTGSAITITAGALGAGVHTVTVDAKDNAGNAANQLVWGFTVATDTIAPTASAPSPAGGSLTGTAAVMISAHLADNAGGSGVSASSVSMTVDGLAVPAITDGVTVSYTAAALSLGVHEVTVDLKDNMGNAATQLVWSFRAANGDVTPPLISAGSPVNVTTNASPMIFVSVTDTGAGVDTGVTPPALTLDGTPQLAGLVSTGNGINVTFTPLTALSLGVHHVSVDATDLAGNKASQYNWTFTVVNADTIAPTASVPTPAGASLTGTVGVVISAQLADNSGGSGVNPASVSMTVDGLAVPATTDGVTVSYTAATLSVGVHHVTVDLKDNVGNAATQLGWSFQSAPVFCPGSNAYLATVLSGQAIGAMATDSSGNYYVAVGGQVLKFDPSGHPAAGFTPISVPITIGAVATGIAVDNYAGGSLYLVYFDGVYYPGASRYDLNGNSISGWRPQIPDLTGGDLRHYVTTDSSNNVYFMSVANSYVQVRSPDLNTVLYNSALAFGPVTGMSDLSGSVIYFNTPTDVVKADVSGANAVVLATFSGIGSGGSITSDAAGNFYTANPATGLINKYDPTGAPLGFVGGVGSGPGKFNALQGIALDPAGDLVAGDSTNQTLQRFQFTGGSGGGSGCGFDTTPPVASAPYPAGASTVGTSMPLIWAKLSDDLSGVAPGSVSMTVDGLPVAAFTNGAMVSFTAGALSDGVHQVTIDLKDKAGNQATQLGWSFKVKVTAPFVSLNGLAYGAVLNGTTTAYSAQSNGVTRVAFTSLSNGASTVLDTITYNGSQWTNSLAAVVDGSTLTWDTTTLPDGSYLVQAVAWDALGNSGYSNSVPVIVDNSAPTLNAISSPIALAPLFMTAGKTLPVSYSYSEANPRSVSISVVTSGGALIASTVISSGLAAGDSISRTDTVSVPVGTADGVYGVQVALTDKARHASSITASAGIVIDSVAPVFSGASVTGTTSNTQPLLFASLTDTASASASGISLTSVVLTLDGAVQPATVMANATEVDITFTPATALALGGHHVSVDGMDKAGNHAAQYNWVFTVVNGDTIAPTASAPSPPGASLTITSGVLISARLSDNSGGSGVNPASVSMTVDGLAVPATTDGVTVSYTAASLSVGMHHVTVDLKDNAGNAATQLGWSFLAKTQYCVAASGGGIGAWVSSHPVPGSASYAIAGDPAGNVYYADFNGNRVTKFAPDGSFITAWAVNWPVGVAIAPSGDVYVSSLRDQEVYQFNNVVYSAWPANSFGPGFAPYGIAVDAAGNEFVSDFQDNEVEEFDSTGAPIRRIGIVAGGQGNGQFNGPWGVAVNAAGDVYVADMNNNRIQHFDNNLNYLGQWGTAGFGTGSNPGEFFYPTGVAIDPIGNVYVGDSTNSRVQAFTATGGFLDQAGSYGVGNGQFYYPDGLGIAGSSLVVANYGRARYETFNRLATVGAACAFDSTAPVASNPLPQGVTSSDQPMIWASLSDAVPGSGVDPTSLTVTVDGMVQAYTASPTEVTISTGTLAPGLHTATVDLKDYEGNVASQLVWSFTVATDTVPPTITLASPVGVTSNASPMLFVSVSDTGSGVDTAVNIPTLTLDGTLQAVGLVTTANGVNVTFTPGTLADGVHHVSVDATDLAGNKAPQYNWTFTVASDTTPPVISAGSPMGVTSNVSTLITAAFTETGSGINTATAVMRLDGAVVASAANGTNITFTAAALADGLHTVTVDVRDNAGNIANQLVWHFTVSSDVTAPVISLISAPTTASPVTVNAGSSVDVSYSYTEANPAYVSVTVRSAGVVIGSKEISTGLASGTASRTDTVQLSTLAAGGSYDVQVTMVDLVALSGTATNAAAVVVDRTPPTASSALPTGTVTDVNGNTTVSLQLADSGGSVVNPASVKLSLDGVLQPSATAVTSATGVSVSCTATNLAAGLHTVSVDFADAVGNTAATQTWSFTMVRDNTAPVVSLISAPTTALPVTVNAGSTVNVSYSYTEVNPAYVSITVRSLGTVIGSQVVSTGLASGTASRTDAVQLSTLAAGGSYDVQVAMVDLVALSGTATNAASVVVDRTPPTASAPLPAVSVTSTAGTAFVSLQLADAGGSVVNPASVKLTLDGIIQAGAVVAAAGQSVSLTASNLTAGVHTVSVDFADAVGNTAPTYTWSFLMVRDTTSPVLAILSPTSATVVYGHATGTVDVTWAYTDGDPAWASVTIQKAGVIIGQTLVSSGLAASPAGLTLTTAVPLLQNAAAGTYDVVVAMVASSSLQGSVTSAASVVLDNTAPTASGGLPAGGSIQATASPVVSAVLADAGGSGVDLNSVVLKIDGVVTPPTSLTAALLSFNSAGLADGPHTVQVDLKDRSGNPALSYGWSFRTDTTAPAVALTAPLPGAFVRGTVALNALATDSGSGVSRTAFFRGVTAIDTAWFNGSNWADNAGALSPGASVLWNTSLVADGAYQLKALSTDLVGNAGASVLVSVTVDNTAPVVAINPAFSPTQYQSQTITGSVTEANLAAVTVNGVAATLGGSAPNWSYSAVLPLVSGANAVTVTATDLAGNQASASTSIVLNPSSPVYFITPLASTVWRGTVPIQVVAPDLARTLRLELSKNNGATWYDFSQPANAGQFTTLAMNPVNGWRLNWDTVLSAMGDANGSYQVRATAFDQYGAQLGQAVLTGLTVDNTPPVASFIVLPAPVSVTGQLQVYVDQVNLQGSIVEAGSGASKVLLEQYNSAGAPIGNSPAWLPILASDLFSLNLTLVPGYNLIKTTAYDVAGNASAPVTMVIYYLLPQNSATVCGPGGAVTAPDGTSINIPGGALVSCVNIAITAVPRGLLASPEDPHLQIVGYGHQIDPSSLVFQAEAHVTLPYTDADLDPAGSGTPVFLASSLTVLFWDGSVWQTVGADNIDQVARRVTVRTNHLGIFALAANTAPIPTAVKVYVTHNPFKYGDQPTSFVYELPSAGSATIRIYDINGNPVRDLVVGLHQAMGTFTQVWDGLNNFSRFVGTGVYIYRFHADLDNGKSFNQTKLIGVVK